MSKSVTASSEEHKISSVHSPNMVAPLHPNPEQPSQLEWPDNVPIPKSFLCPLTQKLLIHPVIDREGNSYEESAILQYLRNGNIVSPVTQNSLKVQDLVENRGLKMAIGAALEIAQLQSSIGNKDDSGSKEPVSKAGDRPSMNRMTSKSRFSRLSSLSSSVTAKLPSSRNIRQSVSLEGGTTKSGGRRKKNSKSKNDSISSKSFVSDSSQRSSDSTERQLDFSQSFGTSFLERNSETRNESKSILSSNKSERVNSILSNGSSNHSYSESCQNSISDKRKKSSRKVSFENSSLIASDLGKSTGENKTSVSFALSSLQQDFHDSLLSLRTEESLSDSSSFSGEDCAVESSPYSSANHSSEQVASDAPVARRPKFRSPLSASHSEDHIKESCGTYGNESDGCRRKQYASERKSSSFGTGDDILDAQIAATLQAQSMGSSLVVPLSHYKPQSKKDLGESKVVQALRVKPLKDRRRRVRSDETLGRETTPGERLTPRRRSSEEMDDFGNDDSTTQVELGDSLKRSRCHQSPDETSIQTHGDTRSQNSSPQPGFTFVRKSSLPTQPVSALDQFEDRLRRKMSMESNPDNSLVSQKHLQEIQRMEKFEERLRRKLLQEDSGKKHDPKSNDDGSEKKKDGPLNQVKKKTNSDSPKQTDDGAPTQKESTQELIVQARPSATFEEDGAISVEVISSCNVVHNSERIQAVVIDSNIVKDNDDENPVVVTDKPIDIPTFGFEKSIDTFTDESALDESLKSEDIVSFLSSERENVLKKSNNKLADSVMSEISWGDLSGEIRLGISKSKIPSSAAEDLQSELDAFLEEGLEEGSPLNEGKRIEAFRRRSRRRQGVQKKVSGEFKLGADRIVEGIDESDSGLDASFNRGKEEYQKEAAMSRVISWGDLRGEIELGIAKSLNVSDLDANRLKSELETSLMDGFDESALPVGGVTYAEETNDARKRGVEERVADNKPPSTINVGRGRKKKSERRRSKSLNSLGFACLQVQEEQQAIPDESMIFGASQQTGDFQDNQILRNSFMRSQSYGSAKATHTSVWRQGIDAFTGNHTERVHSICSDSSSSTPSDASPAEEGIEFPQPPALTENGHKKKSTLETSGRKKKNRDKSKGARASKSNEKDLTSMDLEGEVSLELNEKLKMCSLGVVPLGDVPPKKGGKGASKTKRRSRKRREEIRKELEGELAHRDDWNVENQRENRRSSRTKMERRRSQSLE